MTHELKKLLVAPGEGVHTVHTAQNLKNELYPLIYKEDHQESWLSSFDNIQNFNNFILGVPSDCGAGIVRGSNWGPLFLRKEIYSNLKSKLENETFDLGDIRIVPHLLHDKYLNESTIENVQKSIYGEVNNLPVSPLSITSSVLDEIFKLKPQAKILSLGGDHSISYPLVNRYLNHYQKKDQEIAIIHFDAHTDLMKERMGIDYCFASWAGHIADEIKNPQNFIQFGIRSSGQNKLYWENKFNIKQYWSRELKTVQQIEDIIKLEIDNLKKRSIKKIYISFDIDALDAKEASATGTPEKAGITLINSIKIIKSFCKEFELCGCDLVEVAPFTLPYQEFKNSEPQNTLNASLKIIQEFIKYMNNGHS